ncbi:hypothetical protein TNCV_870781 [Trichonephila clavipes]|nr:hypothetical protein TNCV_870781 [Trichonephila clavipes]
MRYFNTTKYFMGGERIKTQRLFSSAASGLHAPISWSSSSEEFVAVYEDNVFRAPDMADKSILKCVHSSKNIIAAISDNENGVNKVAPDPASSEMRNIMKSMRSYLDARSDGEINNKICDNLQFDAMRKIK